MTTATFTKVMKTGILKGFKIPQTMTFVSKNRALMWLTNVKNHKDFAVEDFQIKVKEHYVK
jgi:hypothetical protein